LSRFGGRTWLRLADSASLPRTLAAPGAQPLRCRAISTDSRDFRARVLAIQDGKG
jgi:hypothetical protein